jgi:hypothetical protein
MRWLMQKVIDSSVKESITSFTKLIERTSVYMYRSKIVIKELAMARNKFDRSLSKNNIIKVIFCPTVSPASKDNVFLSV